MDSHWWGFDVTLVAMVSSFGLVVLGILVLIFRPTMVRRVTWSRDLRGLMRSVVIPFAACFGGIFITRMMAVGVFAGSASFIGLRRSSSRRPIRDERAFVDDLATWTEQLRDTLAGAHGLEEAILATAPRAPKLLKPEVQRLAAHMTYGSTVQGLRRFADDLDHPTADFVVSALLTASQYQARDLVSLLTHVADCARDEGRMRSRVWVGRARTRSSVRIIIGVVVTFIAGLFLLSADYLSPYSTFRGQMTLLGIGAIFAVALSLMQKMSYVAMPERFIRKRVTQ